ncbi:hypothetical protein, partial [Pseudomonas sp.]|uniref:hypothetical protein n=1 Tax=Pseudomonas sp. TaxID=306 RepID=UPI003564562A
SMIAPHKSQASTLDAAERRQDTPFLYTFLSIKRHPRALSPTAGFPIRKAALYTAAVKLPEV